MDLLGEKDGGGERQSNEEGGNFHNICICERTYEISGLDLSLELTLRLSLLERHLKLRGSACPFQHTDYSPSGNAAVAP